MKQEDEPIPEKQPGFKESLTSIAVSLAENVLEDPETYLQKQRSELLAKTFRHFIKVKEEEVALETVVAAVSNSIRDIKDGDTNEIETMLAEQAMVLHGTFQFYIEKSQDAYTDLDKVGVALKAQRQYERTIRSLSRLREQKIKEIEREEKKYGEQTESPAKPYWTETPRVNARRADENGEI